jgi:hypothetical protein
MAALVASLRHAGSPSACSPPGFRYTRPNRQATADKAQRSASPLIQITDDARRKSALSVEKWINNGILDNIKLNCFQPRAAWSATLLHSARFQHGRALLLDADKRSPQWGIDACRGKFSCESASFCNGTEYSPRL